MPRIAYNDHTTMMAVHAAVPDAAQLAQMYAMREEVAMTQPTLDVLDLHTPWLHEAEAALQAALTSYWQLAQTDADTYVPKVATTLHRLGNLYHRTHRLHEAEMALQEALLLRRQLAETHAAYAPTVATTLDDLARLALTQQQSAQAETWRRACG